MKILLVVSLVFCNEFGRAENLAHLQNLLQYVIIVQGLARLSLILYAQLHTSNPNSVLLFMLLIQYMRDIIVHQNHLKHLAINNFCSVAWERFFFGQEGSILVYKIQYKFRKGSKQ